MHISFIRTCLVLCVFIFSISAHAAGLGKLTINSALGQPFNAEIDLVTVNAEDLSSLNANIASLEAYTQAGMQYEPVFSTFRFSVASRANGEPYIKVSSSQAINEPFINLLVELNWASGRLLREYTVLLDPVDTRRPEPPVAPIVRAVPEAPSISSAGSVDRATPSSDQYSTEAISYEPAVQRTKSLPTPQNRSTYGPVLQGDTLSSIARQVRPEGVNVNQMLVALFRANREAFIANNMNLLRTGVVLRVPDIEESGAISRQQADAEVRLQVSNWQKYRQNLAMATQQTQKHETLRQTDSGQITTTVADTAITSRESPQEVLRLSSGEHVSGSADAQTSQNAVERLRMMEEDAVARGMALKEANERIAMLEKNIDNLQNLLALQNSELAKAQSDAQTRAVSEPPQQDPAEIESIEVLTPELDATSYSEFDLLSELADEDFGFEDAVSTPSESIASDSAAAPAPAARPLTQQEPEEFSPSFIDDLLGQAMDNLVYIGAALILLPLLVLAVKIRNRRKDDEAAAEEEARFEENAAALRNKAAAAVAVAHAADNTEEDHNTFDRDADFFHDDDAKQKSPEDETHHAAMSDPAEMAEDSSAHDHSMELDFSKEINTYDEEPLSPPSDDNADFDASDELTADESTVDQSSDGIIEKAVLNERIEAEQTEHDADDDNHLLDFPENELSAQSDEDATDALNIDFNAPHELSDDIQTDEIEVLEIDLADDGAERNSVNESAKPAQEADNEDALDFSIDFSVDDTSDDKSSLSASDDRASASDLLDANTVQFETDNTAEKAVEIDFSDIDLDLENTPDTQPTDQSEDRQEEPASTDDGVKDERWHEVETKIDLAKAYLDMEDKEGAREMLEEVLQEGDARQQETAQALLVDL